MSLTLPRPPARAAEPARAFARPRPAAPSRLPPWLLPCAGAVLGVVLTLTSKGFLWQDEYAHLQFSRWVWHHPSVAVDLWGRPLATLLYALPALVGAWAARLVTVALAT